MSIQDRTGRRRTLKLLGGLGLGAATFGLPNLLRPVFAAEKTPLMRPIPHTGVTVPAVGLGTARTYTLAGLSLNRPSKRLAELDIGEETLAPLREVMRLFYAEGGRLVDSSPIYGTAEELVGRFATELGIVDDLFMTTKIWTDGREAGIEQMQRSMALLHTEPMDVMLIHSLRDWRTHYKTLRQWQEEGRIRHIGFSHSRTSGHEEVERVLQAERFDVLQINYNIVDTNADRRILPLARDLGVATLINEPFSKGGLFPKVRGQELPGWASEFGAESWAQFFLKFILGHPTVTCALPATSDPKHVVDNTRALYGPVPEAAQRERMRRYVAAL